MNSIGFCLFSALLLHDVMSQFLVSVCVSAMPHPVSGRICNHRTWRLDLKVFPVRGNACVALSECP